MNILKTVIKYKSILVLALAILMGVLFAKTNTRLQAKASLLEYKSQLLEDKNKELEKQRDSLYASLKEIQIKIAELTKRDEILSKQNQAKSKEIEKIKIKYEATNNYSVNYTSDSLRSYFSKY